ncbi:hypothetical protein [Bacillus suaedae]|uniref:Uncharacterized protein n=1 Tax=Halalkalibacter suaedae TaxID=2822140 RepID=A0A940WRR8_9BACI|nr:hypothetical protein [Bacillus suaedae]MBP3949502.1 hypothetical protein [Bacillus suaedae]
MENETKQHLKEAFELFQDAVKQYEKEIHSDESNGDSVKTMKIYLKEKQEIIESSHFLSNNNQTVIPEGHVVTLFYKREPVQQHTHYQSRPVHIRPWLAYPLRHIW